MDATPVVNVQHLHITLPGSPELIAVRDISFSLTSGKTLAIVGESGSGKSLTALALMGLLPNAAKWKGNINLYRDSAQYTLNGTEANSAWIPIRGKVVSMVLQEPMSAFDPVMQVGWQLAESIRAHGGASRASAKQQAIEWLQKVQLPNPEDIYCRYPHQLSPEQKQRVMIAIAMSSRPSLLIADEPVAALDGTVQREILLLLRKLQGELGTAMILITHNIALAAELADDILVLSGGNVVEYGPASQMLEAPKQAFTRALLSCRPGAASKGFRLPVVSDFLNQNEEPPKAVPIPDIKVTKDPLLQVKNLRVWFPVETDFFGTTTRVHRAVEDVTFTMQTGEVLGIIGESGSGKSTITRALMGLQSVESGKIIFDGKDLAHLGAYGWRHVRRHIQMIFRHPYASLDPRLTIGEAIREAMLVHGTVPRREVAKEARRLINLVHLPEEALNRYPHQFSGHQLQRIGIARALALRPKLLICDESISDLDMNAQAGLLNLLKDLQAEFRLTYLFISHDLNVVHYMADRVMVMQGGKIVEAGTTEAVLHHPHHDYTRKLIAANP